MSELDHDDFLAKVEALRTATGLVVTHTTADVRAAFGDLPPDTKREDTDLRLGGRVLFRIRMGRVLFLRIEDRAGSLQVYVRREEVGDATFDVLGEYLRSLPTLTEEEAKQAADEATRRFREASAKPKARRERVPLDPPTGLNRAQRRAWERKNR